MRILFFTLLRFMSIINQLYKHPEGSDFCVNKLIDEIKLDLTSPDFAFNKVKIDGTKRAVTSSYPDARLRARTDYLGSTLEMFFKYL